MIYKHPIFIISNPRSGSSIFRIILNHSNNTIFPPECGFIQWLHQFYKDWDNSRISEFTTDVINSKKMEGWFLNEEEIKNYLINRNPQSYAEACFYVYEFYGKKLGKDVKIWGDKNNYYIQHLDDIFEIYPEAKFIWLRRDSRDVCASYLNLSKISDEIKYKPSVPKDVNDIMNSLYENKEIISNFFSNLNDKNKLIINFEDFIIQDEQTLQNLQDFTGININECIINFNNKLYYDEPNITLPWKEKTKEDLDSNYIMTYKRHKKSQEIFNTYKNYNW